MAKKKDTKAAAPGNEKAVNAPEGCEDAKMANEAQDLPEQIVFTQAEFIEVKTHLETIEREKAETVVLLQRLQADFDNYRKRNASIVADCIEEGARNTIKALLPVLDNFDRAMASVPEGDGALWAEGIKLVQRQLLEALAKQGLEEIPAEGQFDPQFHEAVLQEEVEGKESGEITDVFQKGYKVKNRIVRHSMVKVAK